MGETANGHTGHADEVLRRSRALREDAGALVGELRGAAGDVGRALDLKGRMERSPWLTMAAAVGVGYLLGGGLFTRTTARLLQVGTKVLLLPMVRSQLESLASMESGPASGYEGSEDGQGGM